MKHIAALLLALFPCAALAAPLDKVDHIIVISLENHSFDNLFGTFPGADGLANAGAAAIQTDLTGKPYDVLPPVPDKRFPDNLPNKPFPINAYMPDNENSPDMIHRFYEQQKQVDGGKMDRFAAISNGGGFTMGYYDGSKLGLWQYAQRFTLADHFFHGVFGGSFLNHVFMVCACVPHYEGAPDNLKPDTVTDDGYVVNTMQPEQKPHRERDDDHFLPPMREPTIGDRLTEKGVSWAWYSGGWNNADAGKPDGSFQYHHQAFVYFKGYGPGSEGRKNHLKDETDLLAALKDGSLPSVAFYKPLGEFTLHPGYAAVGPGDEHLMTILKAVEESPVWKSTVVIVTFDENGGFWDHVGPPHIDRFGPGIRVPTLIISPLAKKGFIDHTTYDTASILKLIETRYGLKPLTARDANAGDLANVLAH